MDVRDDHGVGGRNRCFGYVLFCVTGTNSDMACLFQGAPLERTLQILVVNFFAEAGSLLFTTWNLAAGQLQDFRE